MNDNDNETKAERLDRELMELVQELRVLLPGVQVLFAFLLTVPFSVGFRDVTGAERALYFAALGATTVSAVLLIAPSARHRARFRDRDKEALVVSSNRLALLSTAFLAAAMVAVVILVGDYLYNWVVGAAGGFATVGLIAWFWYGWSVSRHVSSDEGSGTPNT